MLLDVIDHTITNDQFDEIREMVYRHCRIRLGEGKRELVRARLAKCLRDSGTRDVTAYLNHVAADKTGREFSRLIDAISTNLTSFFRERNHFQFLERSIQGTLHGVNAAAAAPRIRIWSAGCSTGEEPYSIAMTLLHALEGQGAMDVKILATDISRRVLRLAKNGRYTAAQINAVPAAYRDQYFGVARREAEEGFYVRPEVRNLVAFRYLNLADTWPFTGPFDFVFCRNVMIYFDADTQQRLINRFWDVLRPGGYLFTGHSESLNGLTHSYAYIEPTVYQKRVQS